MRWATPMILITLMDKDHLGNPDEQKSVTGSPDRKLGKHKQRSSPPSSSPSSSSSLSPIQARPYDVLLGRGKTLQRHEGNIQFHKIVNRFRPTYNASRRKDKLDVAAQVVREVRRWNQKQSKKAGYPGRSVRFLRKNEIGDFWEEVSEEVAVQKASHALRGKPRNEGDDDQDNSSVETSPTNETSNRSGSGERQGEPMPKRRKRDSGSTLPSDIVSSSELRDEGGNKSADETNPQSEQLQHSAQRHDDEEIPSHNRAMVSQHSPENLEQSLAGHRIDAETMSVPSSLSSAPIPFPPIVGNNVLRAADARLPLPLHQPQVSSNESALSMLFGGTIAGRTSFGLPLPAVPPTGTSPSLYSSLPGLWMMASNFGPAVMSNQNLNAMEMRRLHDNLSVQLATHALLSGQLQRQSLLRDQLPSAGQGRGGQAVGDRTAHESNTSTVRSSVARNAALIEQLRKQQRRQDKGDR